MNVVFSHRHTTNIPARVEAFICLFSSQFEQLTQLKSTFETRLQRQHELSEVRDGSDVTP